MVNYISYFKVFCFMSESFQRTPLDGSVHRLATAFPFPPSAIVQPLALLRSSIPSESW